MSKAVIVYMKLLDEDVDVWRPVHAEHLDGDRYRLVDTTPDGEVWPFGRNDIVRCERRRLSGTVSLGEDVLVVCERST